MLLYRRGGLLAASRRGRSSTACSPTSCTTASSRCREQSWFVPTPWTLLAALLQHGHELRRLLRDGAAHVVSLRETAEDVAGARREPAEPRRAARAEPERRRVDPLGTHHALAATAPRRSSIRPAARSSSSTRATILGRHVAELGFFSAEEWDDAREQLTDGAVVRRENGRSTVGEHAHASASRSRRCSTLDGNAVRLHAHLPGPHRDEEARGGAAAQGPHGRGRRALRRHRARDPQSARRDRRLGAGAARNRSRSRRRNSG